MDGAPAGGRACLDEVGLDDFHRLESRQKRRGPAEDKPPDGVVEAPDLSFRCSGLADCDVLITHETSAGCRAHEGCTQGKLGENLTTEEGYDAAKRCALSIISHAEFACKNDLSKIKSCVKLTGYVNSTNNFEEQPKVINGASELISSIFGDNGMHARAAVSTNGLPLGVAVEVDAIFETI